MARSEKDSWDLSASVGATATVVAAWRAMASQGPDPLIEDPWADPLVRAVGIDAFTEMIDGKRGHTDDPVFSRQAMNEQTAVRTRAFDDFFMRATATGIRQAVIVASGLDTRAYRLPWPADTVVFEIDQPEVIDFKTRTLSDLGAVPSAERRTVAIDLRDDWPTALRAAGIDTAKPTAWSVEGLLPYLPPEAQDQLLDNITAMSAPGSQVACDHMDFRAIPAEVWAKRLTERSQRTGSTINLAELFYSGDRNPASEYLTDRDWRVEIHTTEQLYAANGFQLPNDDVAALMSKTAGYLTAELTGTAPS